MSRSPDEACSGRRSAPRATCTSKPERAPPREGARPRRRSTFLRGHYPDQVRRSAAVSATLSARLPELPLRCYPVVEKSLRPVVRSVKREVHSFTILVSPSRAEAVAIEWMLDCCLAARLQVHQWPRA